MGDLELMQKIMAVHGARIAKLPADIQTFVAALVANESNGNANAKRFEPGVFKKMTAQHPDWPEQKVADISTSWGLTQIMGYHVLGEPSQLCNPDFSLATTETMIRDFQNQWKLNQEDHASLFRCWNTGRPNGTTYDPNYVANGLSRMQIWIKLLAEETQA